MDNISLVIDSKQIQGFISYSVESDIFIAADSFRVDILNTEINITAGQQCKLFVNDKLELTGIIDRVQHSWSKRGRKFSIEGRDLMGLVVDSYVEVFKTEKDITLKALAEDVLINIPFIKKNNITYGKGDKVGNRTLVEDINDSFFGPSNFIQIKPGKTAFEILNDFAQSRGLIFFSMPDGTFVFGEPVTSGKAEYSMICKKDDSTNNNALEGEVITDISKQYKKVTVLGQQQGKDFFAASEINVSGISEDDNFPFVKPFIKGSVEDGLSPEREAKLIMEQQQFEGFKLKYTTPDHSQKNKNYQANTVCHVDDDILNITGDFLIYSRTFDMNKNGGPTTTLKLSKLGVLPV